MPIRGAPGTGINTIRNPLSPPAPDSAGKVRVSQQYLEVINDGGDNRVRLSQQYLEVINSGGNNKVRLSQQYLEIITEFGTPPPTGPGKSGGAPGHNKPPAATAKWLVFREREQRHRNRRTGRFLGGDVSLYDSSYLPQNQEPFRHIETVKTVRIS